MTVRDRPAARLKRKGTRSKTHEPLLRLVQEEQVRAPVKASRKEIAPLNEAQRLYDAAISANTLTFGIGPAGTGKTWLAAARAAELFRDQQIEKIIITRPAMQAEEELGFLPGDLDEKYAPYFRPVREALEEVLGSGHLGYAIEKGLIEARPLGLLRGATFKHCWVIADEMQNASVNQFKLLLSRIGTDCKMIVNGDPRQMDMPDASKSGLEDAVRRFYGRKSVGLLRFTRADIVRSGFCQMVIEAYEPDDEEESVDNSGVLRLLQAAE